MRSSLPSATALALLSTFVSADKPLIGDLEAYNRGYLGEFPSQTFQSSDIVAPLFQVNTFDPNLIDNSGYIFLTLEYRGKGGPAIFSSKDLSLVYADLKYQRAFDARAQERQGFQYLTFIEGGFCHIFDNTYQKKWTVTVDGLGGTEADIHEFQFTTTGTAIMSVYQDVRFNLTVLGGAMDGWLSDSVFQEVELETNRVTNTKDGHYLVSSRALSAIALLRAEDLNPRWILGGKRNQFKDLSNGNATNIAHQYNARFVQGNESRLSFFDNQVRETGTCSQGNCSRGVVVELDYEEMTVKLLHEFYHPQGISSGSGGSVQGLDNGNFLVGWGANPGITEHLANGTMAMDIQRGVMPHDHEDQLDMDMSVYRAWKMDWDGRPPWGPSIASVSPGNVTTDATIYLSWNGDTKVARWEVYAGEDEKNVTTSRKVIGNSTRTGFETEILLERFAHPKFARAAALDKDGEVLGLTATVDIASGEIHGNSSSIWKIRPDPSDEDIINNLEEKGGDKEEAEEDASFHASPSMGLVFAMAVIVACYHFL
ncbi:hypothetical protein LRP88_03162 [Fusarium phalaenopsidis]